MDRAQLLIALIGSAAVGALISSIIGELGRWRERKSRREELALAKAVEVAQSTYTSTVELIKLRLPNVNVTGSPINMMIRDGYLMIKHLLDHGKLDARSAEELEKEINSEAGKRLMGR